MGGSIQTSPQGIASAVAPAVWNYQGNGNVSRLLYGLHVKTYPAGSSVNVISNTTAWANGSWVGLATTFTPGKVVGVIMYNNTGTVGPIVGELDVSNAGTVMGTFPFMVYGARIIEITASSEGSLLYDTGAQIWIRVRDSQGGQTYVVKLMVAE